jgi:hypothetical protein
MTIGGIIKIFYHLYLQEVIYRNDVPVNTLALKFLFIACKGEGTHCVRARAL